MARLLKALSIMVLVVIGTISVSAPANAADAAIIAQQFPRSLQGTFRWDHGGSAQIVSICVTATQVINPGNTEIIGTGIYLHEGDSTRIKVRMLVDAASLEIRIWESDPEGSLTFDTAGAHVGTLSPDFSTITARWRSMQGQGTLTLSSTPQPACSRPSVSTPTLNVPNASGGTPGR